MPAAPWILCCLSLQSLQEADNPYISKYMITVYWLWLDLSILDILEKIKCHDWKVALFKGVNS